MKSEVPNLRRPVVVVFTGLPGTGKSTMADQAALYLGAPAFSGDWLLGALKPAAAQLAQLDRDTLMRTYHSLLESLMTRQLRLGQSAVLDCLLIDVVARNWRSIATAYQADLRVIDCICSDAGVYRSRVEGRIRAIPGWHEIDWAHVEDMRREFAPLTVDRLVLDAVEPADRNFERVRAYLLGDGEGVDGS